MGIVDPKLATASERCDEGYLDALAGEIRRQAHDGEPTLSLERVLKQSPWSRRQTERLFRERFLTSPLRYFRDWQQDRAFALLSSGKDVLSAAIESGFVSTGRLHDAVLSRHGMTPGEVRRRGDGVTIRYAFFDTPLGAALIAATERGVCALRLCQFMEGEGGGGAALAEIRDDFPQATFIEEVSAVQGYADQLIAFLSARADSFAPRVDIFFGTTFQREVWSELQALRPGDVISYTELAKRVGRPNAYRAVANACAANHLAIAIPCHRVVRSDGEVSGYRWGKEWKKRLIAFETQKREATL
ncbi:MAG: methylated-DNA--[protein]-cysteine S-methyltransferase [Akkermansiaceae bacterium]|nr:methylated-DNA--[protein]-cysteine S-methyltransferase [Armatimonadota bacterium]